MGTKDGNVNTTNPKVISKNTSTEAGHGYAVYFERGNSSTCTFNFYDGVLYAYNQAHTFNNSRVPTDTETNYSVIYGTDSYDSTNYVTATLGGSYIATNSTGNILGTYQTLSAAFSGAPTNSIIKPIATTVTETAGATIASGKTLTLDLDGKTIETAEDITMITNNGNLTIMNSQSSGGVIQSTSASALAKWINNTGTLTLGGTNDFTIKVASTVRGSSSTESQILLYNTGTATLSKGTIEQAGVLTTGGSPYRFAVYNAAGGNMTINGTTIKTSDSSTDADRGISTVSTGTLTITDGATIRTSGVCLASSSNSSHKTMITGGSIYSVKQYCLLISSGGNVQMTGGTMNGKTRGAYFYNNSGNTFTLGDNDGTVISSASATPSITARDTTGRAIGADSKGGIFNFYDGVVKGGYSGSTGYSIDAITPNTPSGYTVSKTHSGSVETAVLVAGAQQNNNNGQQLNSASPKTLQMQSPKLTTNPSGALTNAPDTDSNITNNDNEETENSESSNEPKDSDGSNEANDSNESGEGLDESLDKNSNTEPSSETKDEAPTNKDEEKSDEPNSVQETNTTLNSNTAEVAKVAQVGETSYENLSSAITAASGSGNVVKLLEDISLEEEVTISKDMKVTINLNGKTISSKATNTINNKGTLKIESTGCIKNESANSNTIYNTGKLTVNDGTIATNVEGGNAIYNVDALEINGGNIVIDADNAKGIYNAKEATKCNILGGEILVKEKKIDNYDKIKNTEEFKKELAAMKESYGICNDANTNVVLETATLKVERIKGVGILNKSKGSIILGKNDGTYNPSKPIVQAIKDHTTTVVNKGSGEIVMYDGKVSSEFSISNVITKVLEHYELNEENSSSYIITTLKKIVLN